MSFGERGARAIPIRRWPPENWWVMGICVLRNPTRSNSPPPARFCSWRNRGGGCAGVRPRCRLRTCEDQERTDPERSASARDDAAAPFAEMGDVVPVELDASAVGR
jgi:hypothetical protein